MPFEARQTMCRECPFQRRSARGWLGEASWDPEAFLEPHRGLAELPLPCHMQIDWARLPTDPGARKTVLDAAPLCRGFLVFLRNILALPRDPEISRVMRQLGSNHMEVFSSREEFAAHHARPSPRQGTGRLTTG